MTAVAEAMSRSIANDGVGVVYLGPLPNARSGARGWRGRIVAVEGNTAPAAMLVFTAQRPQRLEPNGRALAVALERHDNIHRLAELSESDGIRMDGLVSEADFLTIFPW